MVTSQYWQVAVEEALSEIGADDLLTPEQVAQLARAMSDAAEMEREATGRHFISDPRNEEIRRLQEKLEATERESSLQESAFRDALRQAGARWEHLIARDSTGRSRDLNTGSLLR